MRLAVFERGLKDFERELSDFDPALITTSDAARAFSVFTALEKMTSAARTLVAARATEGGDWKKEGHRSPASWVAEKTGSGFGEASGMLESSERLVALPETTEALKRGELSAPQLREITASASRDPRAESELLQAARDNGLKGLKDECRRIKARSTSERDARAQYEEIRKTRYLHLWTDPDGAGRVDGRFAPDDFARFCGAIRTEANAVFSEARKSGRRESSAAYQADALVALVTGTSVATKSSGASGKGRPTSVMHLRVDLAALKRGSLKSGETCEIPGVGPVPLATASNVLGDSLLKVIISNGVDVTSVCHVGRAVPAHIRSALEDRDDKCVVPGCDVAKGLEIDHYQIAFEKDGPTELWNLARICRWHHYLKTHCDFALTGEPGSWEWNGPSSDRSPVLTA